MALLPSMKIRVDGEWIDIVPAEVVHAEAAPTNPGVRLWVDKDPMYKLALKAQDPYGAWIPVNDNYLMQTSPPSATNFESARFWWDETKQRLYCRNLANGFIPALPDRYPTGQIGYAKATSNLVLSTNLTRTDVPGAKVTFDAKVDRWYKVTATLWGTKDTADGEVTAEILHSQSGVQATGRQWVLNTRRFAMTLVGVHKQTQNLTAMNYRLTVTNDSSPGVTIDSTAMVHVEDLGKDANATVEDFLAAETVWGDDSVPTKEEEDAAGLEGQG